MRTRVITPRHVIVDPHDGACRGAHDIIVLAIPAEPTAADPDKAHVSLTWGPSALLSLTGTLEFKNGLDYAMGIARQMRRDGEYRPDESQ